MCNKCTCFSSVVIQPSENINLEKAGQFASKTQDVLLLLLLEQYEFSGFQFGCTGVTAFFVLEKKVVGPF